MTAINFKADDAVLEQLWEQRRAQVVRLQHKQRSQVRDLESTGQERIQRFLASVPPSLNEAIGIAEKADATSGDIAKVELANLRASLIAALSAESPAFHPGLANGKLVAPLEVGWFTPYYATLHGSDGAVRWQGYNPGPIKLSEQAVGSGPGWFGAGAQSCSVFLDWWFMFTAPEDRHYEYTFDVPFRGFYVVHADDGLIPSKAARVRIDLSMQGFQSTAKSLVGSTVLDIDSQRMMNDADRFDGWRETYYSDILAADTTFVLYSAGFNLYARGESSHAELDFESGSGDCIGVPWVFVA